MSQFTPRPCFRGFDLLQRSIHHNKSGAIEMRKGMTLAFLLGVASTETMAADYQLPAEVTPQLRAACESDVRRLCIGANPTVSKVKTCVASKFMQLGRRCQMQITLAGLRP